MYFNKRAVALKPWSNSKIGTLETCPFKFDLQYIEKLRKKDIPESLQANIDEGALKYGNSVHRVGELVAKGSSVKEAIKQSSAENNLTRAEKRELKAAKDSVLSFEDRLKVFKDKYSVHTDLAEESMAVDAQLMPCDYWDKSALLRGKLDRILIGGDGTAFVIDLKTSKRATLEYSKDQLDLYSTLILSNYPEVTRVKSALYFTKLKEILWAPIVHRSTYPMNEDNSVVLRVNSLCSEDFNSDEPEIRVNTLCKWCDYRKICKIEQNKRRTT